MNQLSLKQIVMTLAALLFSLGAIVAAGISYLSNTTEQIDHRWVEFQAEYSEKIRLKGALDMALGYGGMIHKFKNLVLRKDLASADQVNAHLGAASLILEQYGVLSLEHGEIAAIEDIQYSLEQYRNALKHVKAGIQRGESAQTIDKLTKVNDVYAIRGLANLDKENILHRQSLVPGINKAQQLSYLRTRLGYGGMIHNFKNYLLRHDPQYLNAARQAITDSLATISAYQANGANESEKLALNDITQIIQKYDEHLLNIKKAVGENTHIEAIDNLVRVDDSLALRGLNILSAETYEQILRNEQDMTASLKKMQWVEQGMLVFLIAIVAGTISLCVWLIQYHLGRPFTHMINTMSRLAQGDTQVEITHVATDNELGKMSKSIRIFRDAMVQRMRSDEQLQRVNKELNTRLSELEETRQLNEEQTCKALSLAENLAQARDESLLSTQRAVSEKERAKAIIDTVSDGIISINDQHKIVSINPAAEHLFGYSSSELIGKSINHLIPEAFRKTHDDLIKSFIDENKNIASYHDKKMINRRELSAQKRDGTEISVEVGIGISRVDGETIITGIIRDITRQKKLDAMKREFISTVSHELRTPLTAIKGSLGLLTSDLFRNKLEKEALNVLELSQRNTERLTTLVNDLLDFEKLESGKMKMKLHPMQAEAIVKNAIEENLHYGMENQISFVMDKTVDATVEVDPGRIAQVMANLLSNAAKFSENGDTVNVGATRKEGHIHFYVNDHGPGVPSEFHGQIFDRFTQADSSDIRSKGGTGLGMAISKAIIEKHHGQIGFDTEMGKGSCFYFDLPEHHESHTLPPKQPETKQTQPA